MINSKPFISIIIPVYNVEPYVEACLESVMHQTYDGQMECIIVDDCGTDNSMEIVEKLISEYIGPISFIVLHHERNRGLSAARNTGIDVATGYYLFFLDSDDELTDDCIDVLVNASGSGQYGMVVGKYKFINENDVVVKEKKEYSSHNNKIYEGDSILQSYYDREWHIASWNKLYLREIISKKTYRFIEGIIYEDVPWVIQMALSVKSICRVNHITYIYKVRSNSIMNSSPYNVRAHSYLIRLIEECRIFREKGCYNSYIHEIIQRDHDMALKIHMKSLVNFVQTYKIIRSNYKPSIHHLIKVDRFNIQKYTRDFHFCLPAYIAPYWHYFFYYSFLLNFKKVMRVWKGIV